MARRVELIETDWPDFGMPEPPPSPGLPVYQARLAALRSRMAAAGHDSLVVYGDREHFSNLHWLTGFDPRFEEALLVIGPAGPPLLVTGNECAAYVPVSPLWPSDLRTELWQPLSLMGQPRDGCRSLAAILASEGISSGTACGLVGWKYFGAGEGEAPETLHAAPAYLVDVLRGLCGAGGVRDATALMMSPADGLRTLSDAAEIAAFEHANGIVTRAMRAVLFGLREGMSDFEAAGLAGFGGHPLSCHPTFCTGAAAPLGLAGPSGQVIRRGVPLSLNFAVWRANCCRAGWIAESAADLPAEAADYVEAFAAPYMSALADWFAALRPGTPGGEIQALIDARLPRARFGITLNPGHLIGTDEWLCSPVFPGSTLPLRSGHVFQVDVIPSSPRYFSTRMEDTVALADAALRAEISAGFPAMAGRIARRRAFMAEVLGIALPEEVLPLSDLTGLVPPFFLRPRRVLALRG